MSKHSEEFYEDKYIEYTNWAEENGLDIKYENIQEFISEYEYYRREGYRSPLKAAEYFTKYETGYDTARAMLAKERELGGDLKLKDMKLMGTRDFASRRYEAIKDDYNKFRASGMSAAAAKKEIGRRWYGSP